MQSKQHAPSRICKLTKCSAFLKSAWGLIIQTLCFDFRELISLVWTPVSSLFLPGSPTVLQRGGRKQLMFILNIGDLFTCVIIVSIQNVSRKAQFSSVVHSCPTLCEPMNCSRPGLPVHHQLLEFTQTHVHRVGDSIQPSHPLSSSSPPALNPSQHQSLFQ